MADLKYRQDSAPKGGYPEIQFKRIVINRGPSSWTIIIGGITMMALGFWGVKYTKKEDRELRKEKLNGRLFLQPIIEAERDRRYLRAMKAFEAEEALIMKDIPDWKVGESPYFSDKWAEPIRDQLKFPPGEDVY